MRKNNGKLTFVSDFTVLETMHITKNLQGGGGGGVY